MPIPSEYPDLQTWFNQFVGELGDVNSELYYVQRYWPNLTAQQKTAIKTAVSNKIDDAKTGLDAVQDYINNEA